VGCCRVWEALLRWLVAMGQGYYGFLRWQCGFFLRFVRASLVCRILVSEIGRL
jgi:hypothetical protein